MPDKVELGNEGKAESEPEKRLDDTKEIVGKKSTAGERDELNAKVAFRRTLRDRLTKKIFELEEALRNATASDSDKSRIWGVPESTYDEIKALNLAVMPPLCRLSPEQYEDAIGRVFSYQEEFFRIKDAYEITCRPAVQQSSCGAPGTSSQGLALDRKYRLAKFSGDFKRYREWNQLFDVHVHRKRIDPVEKFTLLKEALVGLPASEIAQLEFTASQYPEAIAILEKKFGCPREAEKDHVFEIQRLYKWRDLHLNDKFSRFVSQNVKALISLGKTYESLSATVAPGILACLPSTMREDFTRSLFGVLQRPDASSSELKTLLVYLEREVAVKRACRFPGSDSVAGPSQPRRDVSRRKHDRSEREPVGGSRAFFAKSNRSEVAHTCVFCGSSKHQSRACEKKLTYDERKARCEECKACFKCLGRNHNARRCRVSVKCERCGRGHYEILCGQQKPEQNSDQKSENGTGKNTGSFSTQTNRARGSKNDKGPIFFQTGLAWVNAPTGRKVFRFFIDNGSERSYVSEHVIQSLKLKSVQQECLAMITIGGEVSSYKKYDVFDIGLQSRFDDKAAIRLQATGIPELAEGDFPVASESFGMSPMADIGENVRRREIDILYPLYGR
ncbi:uncharacterized protein LOC108863688 [Galendromus occidentalis]|uniref:Uncharacterized protein LOC108863688 n=1 Tax=Galendromus occidentalis TaxID=34638 RepID=A0AAJ7P8Z5_9ACAR|nr:uncharacterized protein LOC108863688 [Galendromus occidentalis]